MIKLILIGLFFAITLLTSLACSRLYTPPLKFDYTEQLSPQARFEVLDRWLQSLYDAKRFNGSVLIGDEERVLFSKSYGIANPNSRLPLTTNSAFNLASVSKPFTAFAILLLEHNEKLAVTDRLSDHLPELSGYPSVTIEHLLHHTSGIPDYMRLAIKHKVDTPLFTTDDLVRLFAEQKPPLEFEPGDKFQYSNTGYVLLSEIVARVSGNTFQTFMADRLFKPAGLEHTQVFNKLSSIEPENRVYGFKRNWLNRAKTSLNDLNNFDGVAGDGSVYASAQDLHRWHRVLFDGKLLPNSVVQRAFVSGKLNDGSDTGYGYGWFLRSPTVIDHAGGWVGFSTYYYRDLESGNVLVILDNSSNALRVVPKGFHWNSIGLNLIDFVEAL